MPPFSTGASGCSTPPIPFNPRRSLTFVPRIPDGADANGINDVHVDENGIMYVVDRLQGGLYILELNL